MKYRPDRPRGLEGMALVDWIKENLIEGDGYRVLGSPEQSGPRLEGATPHLRWRRQDYSQNNASVQVPLRSDTRSRPQRTESGAQLPQSPLR